jgi:hypothetical protein
MRGLSSDAVIIHAKIDSALNQIIPYVIDAEAFVQVVNAMMKEKNKKEENEVPTANSRMAFLKLYDEKNKKEENEVPAENSQTSFKNSLL